MDMAYMMSSKIFYHPDIIKAYLKGNTVNPITVKIYLTDKCNLKCNYCVYKERVSNDEIEKTNIIPIFDSLKWMGVKGIVFTGGEPTYYPNFNEVVTYAKKVREFDLGLITNGIIYPDVLEDLTWVRFSLDTITRSIYSKMKGRDKLQEVISNINRAIEERNNRKLSITIGVQIVVTKENYKEIVAFIEYWNLSYGVDYCQIRPIENYRYTEEEWDYIHKQLEEIDNRKWKMKVMTTKYKWEELENDYQKTYADCPGADFIGSIDTKGDFYICCTMVKDETAKYGNLISEHPDKILDNRKDIHVNFDYSKCPVACQGSLMNKGLVAFKKLQHSNFI